MVTMVDAVPPLGSSIILFSAWSSCGSRVLFFFFFFVRPPSVVDRGGALVSSKLYGAPRCSYVYTVCFVLFVFLLELAFVSVRACVCGCCFVGVRLFSQASGEVRTSLSPRLSSALSGWPSTTS